MKKYGLLLAVCVLLCALTGCGCQHEWAAATCEADSYCALCGKTEPGTALEHDYLPANYQQGEVCSLCGDETGAPLQPDFEAYELEINAEEDQELTYRTITVERPEVYTVGTVTFSKYHVLDEEADAELIADLEAASDFTMEFEDGFEWRAVFYAAYFYDSNAGSYGVQGLSSLENYYDIQGLTDSMTNVTDKVLGVTVNRYGEDYECLVICDVGWRDMHTFNGWWAIRMPAGYDGLVITAIDVGTGYYDPECGFHYVYEIDNTDSVFFRMT